MKTQLVIRNGNEEITSRWIRFKTFFYQSDNLGTVTYVINIVHFGRPELKNLKVRMIKTQKEINWMDDKSLEGRVYMTTESGGRRLPSFEYKYSMAKTRISNYLGHTEDPILQTLFNRKLVKQIENNYETKKSSVSRCQYQSKVQLQ